MEEGGGGIEILAGVWWWLEPELYVNGFVVDLANILPLIFFDGEGESNMAGSTFSRSQLSSSSLYAEEEAEEESRARLWEVIMLIWPLFMLALFASVVVKTPFWRFFALARCCRRGLSMGANGSRAIAIGTLT